MIRAVRLLIFVPILAGIVAISPIQAASPPITPFVGTFEGTSVSPSSEKQPRKLKVAIKSSDNGGFTIEWQTDLFKQHTEGRRKTQSLQFRSRAETPMIYVAVPSDVTVGIEPSTDPLDGAPFAWARISGKVLTVNVMTITDAGDYVMQTYDRALTKGGMVLNFVRVRNGQVEQRLWGSLERITP